MDRHSTIAMASPRFYQLFKIIFLGVLVFAGIFAVDRFKLSHYFPIKTVRVYGVMRADHQDVQEVVLPLVNHGFFTVNVEYIRDRLLQMPWIANINVRRDWPDKIEITIVERQAVADWNETSLLSESGELFSPKQETYPPHLPKFIGPEGMQMVMLQYFKTINHLLLPLHAKVNQLELTPYATWKLRLDNGITLQLGHKDVLTHLDHFVKVYPKIVGDRVADVDYIDLRYPNGVAVRWKETIKT